MMLKHGRHEIHDDSYVDYISQGKIFIFSCIRKMIHLNLCKEGGNAWKEIRKRHRK